MDRKIPVVDVSRIGLGRAEGEITGHDYKGVGSELRHAYSTVGFAYLSNHGVSETLIKSCFDVTNEFFSQHSYEEKELACPWDDTTTQGYLKPDREMLDVLKCEEGAQALHELRESMNLMSTSKSCIYFPDSISPQVRPALTELKESLTELAKRFYRAISIGLELEKEYFNERHRLGENGGMSWKMRALYYPPIPGKVTPGLVRCGDHADYGTGTFLIQDDMGGLEVKSKSEGWIEATPIPNTIIVNMGEQMEMFTNGLFPATRHRVVVPPTEVDRKKSRQSFAFFNGAHDDCTVEPIHGQEPQKEEYKPINARKHITQKFKATLDDFKE